MPKPDLNELWIQQLHRKKTSTHDSHSKRTLGFPEPPFSAHTLSDIGALNLCTLRGSDDMTMQEVSDDDRQTPRERLATVDGISAGSTSPSVEIPLTTARESILTPFEPVMNAVGPAQYRLPPLDTAFVKAHGQLFTGKHMDKFEETVKDFHALLDGQIGRVTQKFMEQGYHIAVANSVALMSFASPDNVLMKAIASSRIKMGLTSKESVLVNTVVGEQTESAQERTPAPVGRAALRMAKFRHAQSLSNKSFEIVLQRIGFPAPIQAQKSCQQAQRILSPDKLNFPQAFNNGRRGVKGIVNGQDIWAFGDTGAGQNIISSRLVKEMGLKMKHQPTLLRMGNSSHIASPGVVRFPWTFPDDPLKAINISAYVLDDFKYGCLLGSPFLRFTQLMTKNIHRFVKDVFPSNNLWSLNLLGENSQRVQGTLGNDVSIEALADIGSSRNVMNAAWANSMGFTIRTASENRRLIVFPDNSKQATIGQVHTTITLLGGKSMPIIFEILPDCYVDIILGEDFVFDNNLFTQYADAIHETKGIDSTYDLLPMDFEEFSLAKIGSSARGLLRPKHKRNAKAARESCSEREEVRRAKEWDFKYQKGYTAPQAEWDAEHGRRIEHEKRLFPAWQPDEQTSLIVFKPSTNSEVDNSFHTTPVGLSSDTSQHNSSLADTSTGCLAPDKKALLQPTLSPYFHYPDTPSSSSGEFGADEASYWAS